MTVTEMQAGIYTTGRSTGHKICFGGAVTHLSPASRHWREERAAGASDLGLRLWREVEVAQVDAVEPDVLGSDGVHVRCFGHEGLERADGAQVGAEADGGAPAVVGEGRRLREDVLDDIGLKLLESL